MSDQPLCKAPACPGCAFCQPNSGSARFRDPINTDETPDHPGRFFVNTGDTQTEVKPVLQRQYRVWTCKIVVPGDALLPAGFDSPPRKGASEAVEAEGIPVVACISGWGGELTDDEYEAVLELDDAERLRRFDAMHATVMQYWDWLPEKVRFALSDTVKPRRPVVAKAEGEKSCD